MADRNEWIPVPNDPTIVQAPVSPRDQWTAMPGQQVSAAEAEAKLRQGAKDAPWEAFQTVDDTGRAAANAATFHLADRVAGALTGSGTPEQFRLSEEARQRSPYASTAGDVIGGVLGPGLAARSGITLLGRSPGFFRNVGAGGLEAFGYGAAEGAGKTYSDNPNDYFNNALKAGAISAPFGAAAPVAGAVARGIYHGIAGLGAEVPGYVGLAAKADMPNVKRMIGQPDAYIPDYGPSLLGVAQGAYVGAGPGHTALDTVLRVRDAATGKRLQSGVDRDFGQSVIPSFEQEAVRSRMAAMGPEFDKALLNAKAVDTTPIAHWLDTQVINSRGPAQPALEYVRKMLDIKGTPGVLDPHPLTLQQTRTAVRGMQEAETNPAVKEALGKVYKQITDELNAKVPGFRDLTSRYAELGTQERALAPESVGSRIFRTDEKALHPDELRRRLSGAEQPKGTMLTTEEPQRLQQAARYELDRTMGLKGNQLNALNKIVTTPWVAENVSTMWSPAQAQALQDMVASNRNFRNTFQQVTGNSQTAQRTAAKEALDAAQGKIPLETSLTGAVARGVQSTVNAFRREAAENTRDHIAKLMATQDKAAQQAIINRWVAGTENRDRRALMAKALVERGLVSGTPAVVAEQQ